MKNNYDKFDIVLVDYGSDNIGSEMGGLRPSVIIQNSKGNRFSSTTIVLPLTSQIQKKVTLPTHSLIKKGRGKGLNQDSMLLGECIKQISEKRIIQYLGSITDKHEQAEVKRVYLANFGD